MERSGGPVFQALEKVGMGSRAEVSAGCPRGRAFVESALPGQERGARESGRLLLVASANLDTRSNCAVRVSF